MFEPCPLKDNKQCGFAAIYKGNLHCGLMVSSLEGSKVKNLPKCTKEMSKYEKNKYGQQY